MPAKKIEPTVSRFIKALIGRDMKSLLSCYDPEVMLQLPGMPVIYGLDGVEKHYANVFAIGVSAASMVADRVEAHGPVIVEAGQYEMTLVPPGSPAFTDKGKYLLVYRQSGTDWLIRFDMVHSDTSATVANA